MGRHRYRPARMRAVAVTMEAVRQATAQRTGLVANMPIPPELNRHPLGAEIKQLQRQVKATGQSGVNVLNNVAAELRVRADLAELADAGITAKNWKKLKEDGWKGIEVPPWFSKLSEGTQALLMRYARNDIYKGGQIKGGLRRLPDGTQKFRIDGPGKAGVDEGRESRKQLATKIAKSLGRINKGLDAIDQAKQVYEAFGAKGGLEGKAKAIFNVLKDHAVENAGATAGTVLLGAGALALGAGPGLVVLAGLVGGWAGVEAAKFLADKLGGPLVNALEDAYGATLGKLLDWAGIT